MAAVGEEVVVSDKLNFGFLTVLTIAEGDTTTKDNRRSVHSYGGGSTPNGVGRPCAGGPARGQVTREKTVCVLPGLCAVLYT